MEKKKNILVVCKYQKDSQEARVCQIVRPAGFNVRYNWKNTLMEKDIKNVDVVISIGGDGTALSASHFIRNIPLLAVNSNNKKSEGALTTLEVDSLEKSLVKIVAGNYQVEKLERIEAEINGKKQNLLALNEIFIASEKAYLISKYKIKIVGGGSKVEEEQLSSGLIFSTGTGSTAWFKSAGGEPFSPQARHIKMIVREPYFGRLIRFSLLKKNIEEEDFVEIVPLKGSVLAIDSIREFKLKEGDKIKINISKWPLLRIII